MSHAVCADVLDVHPHLDSTVGYHRPLFRCGCVLSRLAKQDWTLGTLGRRSIWSGLLSCIAAQPRWNLDDAPKRVEAIVCGGSRKEFCLNGLCWRERLIVQIFVEHRGMKVVRRSCKVQEACGGNFGKTPLNTFRSFASN